tara:strand:+ start:559 stop:1317 length:759 start_codon:yes stop_codon:yes gene_type:complete
MVANVAIQISAWWGDTSPQDPAGFTSFAADRIMLSQNFDIKKLMTMTNQQALKHFVDNVDMRGPQQMYADNESYARAIEGIRKKPIKSLSYSPGVTTDGDNDWLWIDLYPAEFLTHEDTDSYFAMFNESLGENDRMTYYNFCYDLKEWLGAWNKELQYGQGAKEIISKLSAGRMPLFESFKTIPDYVGPPGIDIDETYTNLIDNPQYQRLKDLGIYLMSSDATTDFKRLLGNLTNSILNWTQTSVDNLLNFK